MENAVKAERKSEVQVGAFTLEFVFRGSTTEEREEIRSEVQDLLLQMHFQARRRKTPEAEKENENAA
jgi:hypothetical protein